MKYMHEEKEPEEKDRSSRPKKGFHGGLAISATKWPSSDLSDVYSEHSGLVSEPNPESDYENEHSSSVII